MILTLALLGAACSSNGSSGGGGTTPSSSGGGGGGGGGGTTVTMQGFAFHPDALTLPAGKVTLTVTNDDSTLHSFTLDDGSVSKDVQPGATEQVTITVPSSGTLAWHCRIHPSMTGTITVG
jgi:plastocyanin